MLLILGLVALLDEEVIAVVVADDAARVLRLLRDSHKYNKQSFN